MEANTNDENKTFTAAPETKLHFLGTADEVELAAAGDRRGGAGHQNGGEQGSENPETNPFILHGELVASRPGKLNRGEAKRGRREEEGAA